MTDARYRIAGDWGTSRLRLFRIEQGLVVDRVEGPGIAMLDDTPESVLRRTIAPWRADGDPAGITLCGMVGSRNGWIETPYVACPADATVWRAGAGRIELDGIPVTIMAGLSSQTTPFGDVMRGEETQIFGAIAEHPALREGRHRIVLPGTHSKWVSIQNGRVVDFRTYVTGELFALLSSQSTLLRVPPSAPVETAEESRGFHAGLERAHDGAVLAALFETRTAQLLHGRSPDWARGFLSGLLIGHELGAALVAGDGPVTLIGDPALVRRYVRALAARSVPAVPLDGDACVLAGLAPTGADA